MADSFIETTPGSGGPKLDTDLVTVGANSVHRERMQLVAMMRGIRSTNYITLTTTAETTLIAATPSVFHDLAFLLVSNTSTSDVRVDFRDTTGGSVVFSIMARAGDTRGYVLAPDYIQQTTANTNWTAQLSSAVTDVRIFAQAYNAS